MNKKIFAALASATMALSATGSLAVFAEDFDATEEWGNIPGEVKPVVNVKFNETNFPDAGFRDGLNAQFGFEYGQTLTKADIAKVVKFTIPSNVEDLKGIENFTGLVTLQTPEDNPISNLLTADLSANTSLETLILKNVRQLQSLTLPESSNLNWIQIMGFDGYGFEGKAPISVLDLSGNKELTRVVINDTNIANIDLSNNPELKHVNLNNNAINTLDVTGSPYIEHLDVTNNNLYGLDLANHGYLKECFLSGNLLQTLDISSLRLVETLDVSNNAISELDLSRNTKLKTLVANDNHIGALDLSKNTKLESAEISNQILYIDADVNSVDLNTAVKGLVPENISTTYGVTNGAELVLDKGNDATGVINEIVNAGTAYQYETGNTVAGNMTVAILKADLMNRLYNPNSGEHFYTKDTNEKDVLVGLGWQYEGIGWNAPKSHKVASNPVYRLYNPNAGDHHYTRNPEEKDTLVNIGWKYEGIGWEDYTSAGNTFNVGFNITPTPVKVLRQYNPNAKAAGAHNYTINEAENDFLVSVGWLDEGLAWYAMK